MADLADMIQRLAYYQAGGKDPGTGTLDKLNTGVGIVDKTITDVLAIKKAKLEGQKNKLETAKLGSEKTKLDLGNAPASNYLKPATPAGTAGTDGQPVVTPQAPEYDLNRMTPDQQDTFASADLKRAQTEYYRSGQKGGDKLWVNPAMREVSEVEKPGFYRVPSGTAATIAAGPAKEAAITGRQKEMERLNVEPTVKLRYNDLRTNLRLAQKLETGLTWAMQNKIDVTGLLNYPIARFKEFVGTLPKDRQAVLTDLRTNFARFARQMGGTAFTPTEKQIFAPIMPETTLPAETNLNRIMSNIEELTGRISDEEELTPGLRELFGVSSHSKLNNGQHQESNTNDPLGIR